MSNLTKSLPIVAKILGDKYGVRVEIGGYQACTDGQTIYLPALPAEDEKAAVLVRGYIDHEAAHVRFTEGGLEGSPLERALQNILEDIRIDRRMGKRFPGCVNNLDRLATALVADGMFERLADDAHPGAVLQGYLLHRMRHDVLGQSALRELADHSESLFHKVFSVGKATRIAAIAWQAENAASTAEVKVLVSRILESLQQDDEDDEDTDTQDSDTSDSSPQADGESQDQSGQAGDTQSEQDTDQGDDSDDSSDEGSSSQQSSSAQAAGDEADDEPESSEHSQGQGQGGQDAVARALGAGEDDLAQDMTEQISEMLEQAACDSSNPLVCRAATDREADIQQMGVINAKEARKATNALRSRLDGLIQASKLSRSPPRRTGRRLDTQALARLGCGDLRVFRSSAERMAVNTAVHVLLDRSGSMANCMALACEAVYAAAVALEGIQGVNLETAAFPVERYDVTTLTRFGQPVRIEKYELFADGGTPMAEALWHVAHRLVSQPQPRKIALVITDGEPNGRESTIEVLRRMEAAGIETIGVGIGPQAREDLFARSRKIQNVTELPKALFELLEQPLMAQSA